MPDKREQTLHGCRRPKIARTSTSPPTCPSMQLRRRCSKDARPSQWYHGRHRGATRDQTSSSLYSTALFFQSSSPPPSSSTSLSRPSTAIRRSAPSDFEASTPASGVLVGEVLDEALLASRPLVWLRQRLEGRLSSAHSTPVSKVADETRPSHK
ncbi:hypothetical protein PsYK624_111700 [Phanerochaete sordida]|uniref:Uncharacterized protein n=1 Tax=Phanerochaete sordida TaxID=48140 RepID=A0A9P3LIB3_9APHY|nr:hypothetical protein PsYK624_111700 [Phanerochaete sordida]